MLKKGDILDNRFLIDEIIGYGDSSFVFKAFDLKADYADRAVKELSGTEEDLKKLSDESSLMSELFKSSTKFNFIPNIIQRIQKENTLYIVMEFIDGTSMEDLLDGHAVPYGKFMEYAVDICSFISFIHQHGKLYCNIKPDNIMVLRSDENSEKIKSSKRFSSLKFIDFSAVINQGEPSSEFTPEYAAPEQYKGRFTAVIPDEKTDIFNVGAALYHMASGKKPLSVFSGDGKAPEELRHSHERFVFSEEDKINPGLKRIILKCVNDDPKQRYQSCSNLYRELVNLSEHKHIKRTVFLAVMSLLLASGGIFSAYEYRLQSQNQFKYYMDIAKKTSSPKDKLQNYEKAISIEPGNLDAYVLLLDACSYSQYDDDIRDTLFTSEEKTRVLQLIHANKQLLISEKKYEKVAFELGKLIWYHEDYGLNENSDNKTIRMRDAAPYFADAIFTENGETLSKENLEMARTYYNIGKFYDNIITNMSGTDKEVYINFWNDLHSMMNFVIDSNTKNDLVRLETYRTALDALDSYSSYFRECGYTYEQQYEFFGMIRESTEECEPDTNSRELWQLKQNIQDRYSQCLTSLEMTFSS